MPSARAIRALAVTLAACVVAGCADPPPAARGDQVAFQLPSPPRPAWEHTVVVAREPVVDVYRRPDPAASRTSLRPPRLDPRPQTFLVVAEQPDWYRVLLPTRPNGSSGWLRADDVTRTSSQFEVAVDVDERRLTVREAGRVLVTTRVAVGTPATPTPRGRYFVTYAVRVQDPDGVYGPFAIGTSAHSPTLATFNGQDAQIALHGTNQPALLGQAVSNGCIRMPNAVVRLLADRLARGTPVTIT